MTKELKDIILRKVEEVEESGSDSLTDSDVMDIIEEANEKGIPCGRKELHEAGITDQKKAGWIPVEPDEFGDTTCFECPECGMFVTTHLFVAKCDYDYCPYCGSYIGGSAQE